MGLCVVQSDCAPRLSLELHLASCLPIAYVKCVGVAAIIWKQEFLERLTLFGIELLSRALYSPAPCPSRILVNGVSLNDLPACSTIFLSASLSRFCRARWS